MAGSSTLLIGILGLAGIIFFFRDTIREQLGSDYENPDDYPSLPPVGTPVPVDTGRQPLSSVMDYIANQAVEDIDANTYRELGRELKFNLKGTLLSHYKSWLEAIAEYNDVSLKPLQGRALAKYSLLILDVCGRMKIRLNPAAEATYRANLFAGTPMLGQATANFTRMHVA